MIVWKGRPFWDGPFFGFGHLGKRGVVSRVLVGGSACSLEAILLHSKR